MRDPYAVLEELTTNALVRVGELRRAAQLDEPLTRASTRDELRTLADDLAESMRRLVALLDWVEESDLPPGLRTWVQQTGASELAYDPATGRARAAGPPGDVDEPLPALAHSSFMEGEYFEHAFLDVSSLGAPGPRNRELPEHMLDGPEATVKVRATTPLQEDDAEGPSEPATIYVAPRGARRLAAMLRLAADDSERAPREGS